jgi:hypothetical protein
MELTKGSIALSTVDVSAIAATAVTVMVLSWFMADVPGIVSQLFTAVVSGLVAAVSMTALMVLFK